MSDILKFSNAIRLAQLASDPTGIENGVLYYNTASNVVKQYINGGWQEVPNQALTLLGLALNDGEIIVGNASNVSVAVDTTAVGDVEANESTGLTIKTGVIVNGQISASAAISLSKLASLTASRALQSDGSGVISASSVTSTELGYLSGVTSAIQTQLGNKQSTSEKGQANGYASLDGSGKVPVSQLPNSIMEYQGTWDASTNTPTLADGAGSVGDVYRVSVAGTQDLGSGNITFAVGDYAILNASLVWEKADTTDAVSSVNGSTGAVTVNAINELTGDVTAGPASGSQSKVATIANAAVTGAKIASDTITDSNIASAAAITLSKLASLTASRALESDGSGVISPSSVTSTELGYLSGVTSAIQTQLGNKASTTLNNLGTTSINANLIPDGNNTRDLGAASTGGWNNLYVNVINQARSNMNRNGVQRGQLRAVISSDAVTRPDATTLNGLYLRGGDNAGDNFSIFTSNNNSADSVATTNVDIQTGNKTAGTGNSGDITFKTGTSAGGARGKISLDGSSIEPQASIVPNADGTLNLGSSSFKFASAYLGTSLVMEDPGAGTNSVTVQAASGTDAFTLTLMDSLPASTQAVMMDSSGNLSTSAVATASAGDISETTFSGLANNTSNQTITGLAFNNAVVRSARIQLSIFVDATSDQFAVYDLMAIQRGSDWQMTSSFTGDSITGLSFDITSAGQVRASIGNISGFSSADIKFRALTTSV